MSCHHQYRCALLFMGVLIALCLTTASAYSQTLLPTVRAHTLYVPLILNVNGARSQAQTESYQIVFVDGDGAWLYGPNNRKATLLSAGTPLTTTVRAAATGDRIALGLADGWALFNETGLPVANQLAPGYQLDWDQTTAQILLSRIGEGITRLTVATGQRLLLLRTSDETNDHSPFWSADGQSLIFAHQEFGEQLFVTQIKPFDLAQLPYIGENRAAAKFNPQLTLLQATESWHDQPLVFHWSTDGQTLIFAAQQRIHLINLAGQTKVTITPPGFADKLANYAVDVNNDRILYAADGGLYITGLQGGNGELVIAGDNLLMPQWSPDGNKIIYNDAAGLLHIADVTGTEPNVVIVGNTTPIGNFDILPSFPSER